MKGLSVVVVVILLLMISISLTGLAYTTLVSMLSKMTSNDSQVVSQTIFSMMAQMKIDSVASGGTETVVYIKNTGKVDLTNFSAYVNDTFVGVNPSTPLGGKIAPGEVKSINIIGVVASGSIIKITTAQGALALQQLSGYAAVPTCSDGTPYGQCSSTKPLYCSSGTLVNNCSLCGCSSGTCQPDGSCTIIQTNLVGFWKFDEGSGTTAGDSSGNGNNGTIIDAQGNQWTTGRFGSAIQFDSSGTDKIYVNNSPSIDIGGNYTVALWVKPMEKGGDVVVLGKRGGAGEPYYQYGIEIADWGSGTDVFYCFYGDTAGSLNSIYSSTYVSYGIWQHLACTYNGTNLMIYVNGILSNSAAYSLSMKKLGHSLIIGSDNVSQYYQGSLDEIKVFNKALTADEILSQYQSSTLVAYWKFDESSGTVASDSSGNGNSGTLFGNPSRVAGKFGNALQFNGASTYVESPDSNSLDITNGITLEAWVYPSSLGDWTNVIEKNQNAGYKLGFYNNQVVFTLYALWDSYSTGTVPLNQWSYVAATYDMQNVKIYINGALDSTIAHTNPIGVGTSPVDIGRSIGGYSYFNGTIDEVKVWNRALTASEIQSEYGQCTPGNDIIKQTDYPTGSCQSPSTYEWSHSTCGSNSVCNQSSCKLVNSTMSFNTLFLCSDYYFFLWNRFTNLLLKHIYYV